MNNLIQIANEAQVALNMASIVSTVTLVLMALFVFITE